MVLTKTTSTEFILQVMQDLIFQQAFELNNNSQGDKKSVFLLFWTTLRQTR